MARIQVFYEVRISRTGIIHVPDHGDFDDRVAEAQRMMEKSLNYVYSPLNSKFEFLSAV